MASVKFSRKEIEKHIKLTQDVQDKISMLGTHLESLNNDELELEIMPNRPDLYSLQGFLRAFSTFIGKSKGLKKYNTKKPEKNYQVTISDNVKNIRPYTACAIIKNLKFDDEKIKEIIDIQEKIHTTLGRNRKKIAIGIYPLEKITLPIKLEARSPKDIKFIPLEFPRELNGLQILQQHPTGREYAHLLEGLDKFPVFVDAKGEILSMPPIINSHKTGKITEKTKDIFIECSGFDFNILKKTLNILVTMLSDMGGEICEMNLIYGNKKEITPNLEPEKMKLSTENTNKLLGLDLKEKEIKNLLEKMGYDYDIKKKEVLIPAWRADIMHEVDIIEDIAIAYGYEKFIPEIPQISTIGEIDKKDILKGKISDILTGLNITETSSYHLFSEEEIKKLNITPEIEVETSKSEYKYLRNNILCSSLNVLGNNLDTDYPQRIFELGVIFEKDKTNKEETGIKEKTMLSIALASQNSGFTEIKQTLDYLMKMLNKTCSIEHAQNSFFIEGRCGKIILNSKEIGYIGEVSPSILSNLKIKMPVCALYLDIEDLI